jgi:hypothetical protein
MARLPGGRNNVPAELVLRCVKKVADRGSQGNHDTMTTPEKLMEGERICADKEPRYDSGEERGRSAVKRLTLPLR